MIFLKGKNISHIRRNSIFSFVHLGHEMTYAFHMGSNRLAIFKVLEFLSTILGTRLYR